jgi:Ser/Thr protein kinase RdoA (MazF antagonist)
MTIDSSQAFFQLTPERVLSAVERLGVRCTGRMLALNSMENRVYEVELDIDLEPNCSKLDAFRVVKFYRPGRWSREQISEEHEFLNDLLQVELPVVAPLRFPSGLTIECLESDQIYYSVFPKVAGRINDELEADDLEQIGRLIARMHNAGSSRSFRHRLTLSAQSYGYDNLEYLRTEKLIPDTVASHYLRLGERITKVAEGLLKEIPIQRIHGDCHLGNVLWLGARCSIVDFDDSVMGPCEQDLWLLTPGRDSDSLLRQEAILRGYRSMRPDGVRVELMREPLRALRMVHFTTWIAKRFVDPAFQRVFVDYGSERYWRQQLIALQEVGDILGIG